MSNTRPTNATAAGWLVVGQATLALVSALGGLLAYSIVGAPPFDGPTGPLHRLFQHYAAIALTQTAVALATLLCGVGVLRRMPWARRASQAMMIAWAAALVGLGIWMASWFPLVTPASPHGLFLMVWKAAAIASGFSWAVPLLLAVWLLHSRAVREWFQGA